MKYIKVVVEATLFSKFPTVFCCHDGVNSDRTRHFFFSFFLRVLIAMKHIKVVVEATLSKFPYFLIAYEHIK
jgi:hypothetical protein